MRTKRQRVLAGAFAAVLIGGALSVYVGLMTLQPSRQIVRQAPPIQTSTGVQSGKGHLSHERALDSPDHAIEQVRAALDVLASHTRPESWPEAIKDCELALLLPATREIALRQLRDAAYSFRDPISKRYLAVFIIGDAAPDLAKDCLWDLTVPQQGSIATPAMLALMIDDRQYSSFELWREILTGDYARTFLPMKVVEDLTELFDNPESRERFMECFGITQECNTFRRTATDDDSRLTIYSPVFNPFPKNQEFEDRIVGLISGLSGAEESQVLWRFMSGSSCPALKQLILQGHHDPSVREGAIRAIDDDRFLIDNYRTMGDSRVRWGVLEKVAFYYDARTHDRVLELCKEALTFERVPPVTLQRMAYGASITDNTRVVDYLGRAALHSVDSELRDAIMAGFGKRGVGSEAVYGAFRMILKHREEQVRIRAIGELVRLRDPSARELCDSLGSDDPSENVRRAARKLGITIENHTREN